MWVRAKEKGSQAVFVAAWLVGVTREFAHGMTRKVFGGRATEVSALLVYYFLPRFNATSQPFTSSATQAAFVGDCGGSLLAIDGGLRRIIVPAPPNAAYRAFSAATLGV